MHLISTEDLNVLCNHAEDGGHGDVVDIIKRRIKSGTGLNEVAELRDEIRKALEGDSNDDEHEALMAVADAIGLQYTTLDERESMEDDMASDMEASALPDIEPDDLSDSRYHEDPSDTADAREDMERELHEAEIVFEAAGGRGVELAETIDRLRHKLRTTKTFTVTITSVNELDLPLSALRTGVITKLIDHNGLGNCQDTEVEVLEDA